MLKLLLIDDLPNAMRRESQPLGLPLLYKLVIIVERSLPLPVLVYKFPNHPMNSLARDLLIKPNYILAALEIDGYDIFVFVLFVVFRNADLLQLESEQSCLAFLFRENRQQITTTV